MSQLVSRRNKMSQQRRRLRARKAAAQPLPLRLESLEQRLLLDVAGWWDELGFRSGSGGGITWDPGDTAGESQLVLSPDGDPVIIWTEGTFNEYVQTPIPYHWEVDGEIYVKQYADMSGPVDMAVPGWWDLYQGSSAGASAIGVGRQISAASGPNGEIVVVWLTGQGNESEIHGRIWNGRNWVEMAGSATMGGISSDGVRNEKPDVAINAVGEVFVSYTAMHPATSQREIVVKKFGYDYASTFVGPPSPAERVWTELTSDAIGQFGQRNYSGVSADQASSFDASLTVDLTGRPLVAWASARGQDQSEIYVKRWNGSAWEEVRNSHSASDADGDGRSGVSNDPGMSIQPDIAVTPAGDIVVSWVNWADWENYDNPQTSGGKAGIFAKVLRANTSTWTAYTTQHAGQNSATNRGLAQTLGWYYSPEIAVDSSGNPVVTWQGFGTTPHPMDGRYAVDRDGNENTPGLPGNPDRESPVMAIYASAYNGASFDMLTSNTRYTVNSPGFMCWMPAITVTPQDEIIAAYTWRDSIRDDGNRDYEIFVQRWDANVADWVEHGRGSSSTGNDVIGPRTGEQRLGLIDFSNNPSNPDVLLGRANLGGANAGALFRYSRSDDSWHRDVSLPGGAGFGRVFDLKGEPEAEYNITGSPLLAYLDDVTGLPYVYRWTNGAWNLVGGGAAANIVGNNHNFNPNGNRGISVQAGPNNTVLLAYLKHTTTSGMGGDKTLGDYTSGSDDVVTLYWDGVSWNNLGDGVLKKDAGMGVAYYADFDGFDFSDGVSALPLTDDGIVDQDNVIPGVPYSWISHDVVDVDVEEGNPADGTPGAGFTREPGDAGFVISFDIPTAEDAGDDWPGGGAGVAFGGLFYLAELQSWAEDIVIEFSYEVVGYPGGVLALWLAVDGEFIDMDPSMPGVVAPIFPHLASPVLSINYSEDTIVSVDLKTAMEAMVANGDLDPNFWTGSGEHVIELVATMEMFVFPDDALPDGSEPNVKIDNFAVYQRIVGQSGYVNGGVETYPRLDNLNFTFDNSVQGWAFTHNSADNHVTGGHAADAGLTGPDDGGLRVVLGDGKTAELNLEGVFSYTFELASATPVNLDLDYSLLLGADIGGGDNLALQYQLNGGGWLPIDMATGPGGTVAYTSAPTINLNGGAALAVGEHTVEFRAFMDQTAGTPIEAHDFEASGNLAATGWNFVDDPTRPAHTDGVWVNAGGGGADHIKMTLGDGATAQQNLQAGFNRQFNLALDGNLLIDFDYVLATGNGLQAGDTLEMIVRLQDVATGATTRLTVPGRYQVSGPGVSVGGSISLDAGAILGELPAGNYRLIVQGVLSNSRNNTGIGEISLDNVNIYNKDRGVGTAQLDNIQFSDPGGATLALVVPSNGIWAVDPGPLRPTGGNNAIGPWDNPASVDRVRKFDFQQCLYTFVAGRGLGETVMDTWLIEDVISDEDGPMIISFRYRLVTDGDPANTNIGVYVDGTLYNVAGDNAFVVTPTPDYGLVYANTGDTGWWNGHQNEPAYTYVYIVTDDIAAGSHDVRIELNVTDEPTTTTSHLWMDNLSILVARPTDAKNPIATLLPNRQFAVGVTNESIGLEVYHNDNTDPVPDARIQSFSGAALFGSGYSSATIFQQSAAANEWIRYGKNLGFTQEIDFLGFSLKDNLQHGGLDDSLGAYTRAMPAPELYALGDLAVGPNSYLWVALQHATTSYVDTNGDGEPNRFDIHPWITNLDIHAGIPLTTLDVEVWRWQPHNVPGAEAGTFDRWVNTGFAPQVSAHAYTHPQLVSSGGQLPTVAWTRRDNEGRVYDSAAQRYGADGVWGVLNTESVQNNQFWSSIYLDDMIVKPDGFPVVAYHMAHLNANGLREFRSQGMLPNLVVTENSGIPNDDILEFGGTTGDIVDRAFTMRNVGPGDLVIYDIAVAAPGGLDPSPFRLRDNLNFPIVLEGDGLTNLGEQLSVAVRFDPENVPPGDYTSILVIHSNDPDHPSHDFGRYYEIILQATVLNSAEVVVTPRQVQFADTVVNQNSSPQNVVVRNIGTEDLTVSEWFFDGVNFSVIDAFLTVGENIISVNTTNVVGPDDDVIIPPGAYLTLGVQFSPDGVGLISETLYFHTDDSDEPYVPVVLFGNGISGASIIVTEQSGTPNDDLIEFGSVILGQQKSQTFTVTNSGTTDLTLVSVIDVGQFSSISITPFIDNRVLTPGESLEFTVIYSPALPLPGETPTARELDTLIRIVSDDPIAANRTYELEVTGLGVPQVPIFAVAEVPVPGDPYNDLILEFGDTGLLQPVTRQLRVENLGGATLTLESFRLSDATAFSVLPVNQPSDDTDDILLPHDSAAQIIEVTFAPLAAQTYNQTLRIYYYDATNTLRHQTIYLQGTGADPVARVTDSQGDPGDGLIDFGAIGVNQTSPVHTITVSNHGNTSLTITNWALTAGDPDIFHVEAFAGPAQTLNPGQNLSFEVAFTPDTQTAFTGTVTITSNDPATPSWEVDLAGSGAGAGVVTVLDAAGSSVTAVDFTPTGPLVYGIGETVTQTLTIYNSGGSDLVLKALTTNSNMFRLDPALSYAIDTDDVTLAPGQGFAVNVTFLAANLFSGSADLVMITNDLQGTGDDVVTTIALEAETIYAPRIGAGGDPYRTWIDSNGRRVTIFVVGGGAAVIIPASNGEIGSGDIAEIRLIGATPSTTLLVSSAQGTEIGAVTGNSAGNLLLTNVTLTGAGLDIGNLNGFLRVGDLSNGADINIAATGARPVMMLVGAVGDGSMIDVNGAVSLFQATSFGDATLQTGNLGRVMLGGPATDGVVRVDGNLGLAMISAAQVNTDVIVDGDLNQLLALNGTFRGAVRADNIGTAMFRHLDGAAISAPGRIRMVFAQGDMVDSLISAGFDLGADGRLGGLPDTLVPGGEIGNVRVTGAVADSFVAAGIRPTGGDFFTPAETRTGSIGAVSFGRERQTGTPFGVAAHTNIRSVMLGINRLYPGDVRNDFEVHLL